MVPRRQHLDQQRLANLLSASQIGPLQLESDEFGNDIAAVSVARVEREIVFSLEAEICATGASVPSLRPHTT